MEQVLELLKSLSFLKAVCYVVEVLVITFAPQYALPVGGLLLAVVAVLNMFGIKPELMLKRELASLKAVSVKKAVSKK